MKKLKWLLFSLIVATVMFVSCTDQTTVVILDDECLTCDENGYDTTLVSYCFKSPEIISQGTLLKNANCCPEIQSLYVYNFVDDFMVTKNDLTPGSVNSVAFTNPNTYDQLDDFCIDWLLIGPNNFLLITTDKVIENGYGVGIVNTEFPSDITGYGKSDGEIILDESSDMDAADIYAIQSTLKFNVKDLQEHHIRYTFVCTDQIGFPDPTSMYDFNLSTFVNGDNSFDRPIWEVETYSPIMFTIIINQNSVIMNNHNYQEDDDGYITIIDNKYSTGKNFTLQYTKEYKNNGEWITLIQEDLNAPDQTRWIYGGIERKITFLQGDPNGNGDDDTGTGCLTVSEIGQETISQDVRL